MTDATRPSAKKSCRGARQYHTGVGTIDRCARCLGYDPQCGHHAATAIGTTACVLPGVCCVAEGGDMQRKIEDGVESTLPMILES